jgi:hypothetical protein
MNPVHSYRAGFLLAKSKVSSADETLLFTKAQGDENLWKKAMSNVGSVIDPMRRRA